jgi:NAD(P)-dependent dehydrogenase (short-subunit alcohol dehydrogenase family)
LSSALDGRIALITGGGRGIGRACAEALALAGARVAIVGRDRTALDDTTGAIGDRARAWTLDVRDVAAVDGVIGGIAGTLGPIDILVNNAAVSRRGALVDLCDRDWADVVDTGLTGLFYVTRAVLRGMPDGGRIVNMSSVLGKFGVAEHAAYCAVKHGVIGFTRALALEVARRRITVNALTPGWVETAMAQAGFDRIARTLGVPVEEARRQALRAVPLGRILQPSEVAGLVVFLCTPAADGITGQALSIDGGQTVF